jgi:hypothetical protein
METVGLEVSMEGLCEVANVAGALMKPQYDTNHGISLVKFIFYKKTCIYIRVN